MKKTFTYLLYKIRLSRSSTLLFYFALLLIGLGNPYNAYASNSMQEKRVSISAKDVRIDEVLESLTQQTGFNFVYSSDDMHKLPAVTLEYTNETLEKVLEACFRNTNYSFELTSDNVIVIKARDSELNQSSKPFKIKGRIIDEFGSPLINATIRIKGTTSGVIADQNGNFSISLNGPSMLTFSFIGFETKEVQYYEEENNLTIQLNSEVSELGDIEVISTGYQEIKKAAATGSYGFISSLELEDSPNVNIMSRLEGRVPGVRFDVNDNSIQIRGTNTFFESRPPLVVIDGFPALKQSLVDLPETELSGTASYETNNAVLSAINPNDIKSITFLKDAAASAIWGSQAANGVIVIETKKGQGREDDMPVVTFNSQLSVAAPSDLSELDVMNSRQYIELEQELFDLGYVTDPTSAWRYSNESEALNLMFANQRGELSDDELASNLSRLGNVNNQDEIRRHLLQNSITQQYNMSVSGNNKTTQYYLSGGYSSNRPVFKSNDSKQYSVRANLTTKLFSDRITLSSGINTTISKNNVNGAALSALTPGVYGLRPYDRLFDENGESIDRYLKFTPDVIDDFTSQGYLPWTYNTIDELNYNSTHYNKNATQINARLTGKVTDWLNLSVSGNYQHLNNEWRRLEDENSYSTRDLLNEGTTVDASGNLVYGVPMGGIYKTSNTYSDDYSVRGQLDVNKKWNNIHHLTFVGGSEIRQSKASGYTQTRYGYDKLTGTSAAFNPTTPYNNIYSYTFTLGYDDGSIYQNRRRYLSYYGNANYDFKSKYFLSGSLRFDDTNMLGVDRRNRAQPLWSAGAKWRISEESFLKGVPFVDYIDLRLTYGKGGSAPIGGSNVSTISILGNDYYTGLPYASLYPGNSELGWETTKTFNAGLDFALFKRKLTSTIEVYTKRSSGILVSLPINATYGQNNLLYNTGTLAGHGVDFGLHGTPVRSTHWTCDIDYNLSYNTNEVTDNRFPNTMTSPTGTNVIEGYPVDYLFTYRWAGLDANGQSQIYDAEGNVITSDMSSVAFKPEDFEYSGRRTPSYFGSLSTTLRYKHLSLFMMATYSMGNKILVDNINSSQYPRSGYYSGYISNSEALVNRWRAPGDEEFTDVPGMEYVNFTSINRYQYANINVISGSHIRMKQISLNYQMPSRIIEMIGAVQSVKLGASVENLGLIWSKNKDYDPEYIFSGTYSSLPPSSRFSFNLNVTF